MEFGLLIGNGMTPLQALYADLVAATGNPLDNPQQFKQINFVMKGGLVYRREGAEIIPTRN